MHFHLKEWKFWTNEKPASEKTYEQTYGIEGGENAATLQDTALEQEVSNKNNKHLWGFFYFGAILHFLKYKIKWDGNFWCVTQES